jgi:hypothetical protein
MRDGTRVGVERLAGGRIHAELVETSVVLRGGSAVGDREWVDTFHSPRVQPTSTADPEHYQRLHGEHISELVDQDPPNLHNLTTN